MTSLVLWCGPVSAEALAGVVWQSPTQVVTFGQGFPGPQGGQFSSAAFHNLGTWARGQSPSGTILDGLLASKKLPPASTYDRIAVAGFSAGHALLNALLLEDSARISAAVALDSCYSDFSELAKPGYVAFGALAAKREKVMVLTSSAGGGGPSYSTGAQCVRASFAAAASTAGVAPVTLATSALGTVPPPAPAKGALWARAGDLFMLDYGSQLGHTQHVWLLAKPVFEAFVVPYLATGLLPPSLSGAGGVVSLLPMGAGVIPVPIDVPPAPGPTDPEDMPEEEREVSATVEETPDAPLFTTQRVLGGLGLLAVLGLGVVVVRDMRKR